MLIEKKEILLMNDNYLLIKEFHRNIQGKVYVKYILDLFFINKINIWRSMNCLFVNCELFIWINIFRIIIIIPN